MPKTYWLKMIGAADNELDDRWIETDSHLLKGVRFGQQPSGISRGDHLVYYSAGSQKIFAIARAKSSGAEAPIVGAKGEGRWPYLLDVQTLVVIPQLVLAPHWSVLDIPSSSVQQQSHIEIPAEKYALAHQAIAETGAPEVEDA
jgi:hypothetical protein